MRKSISQGFLLRLGLTSIACTVLASVAAFVGFQHELEQRQVRSLTQYVQERTDNVDRRFSDLIVLQQTAIKALETSAASLTPETAKALIERQTVLMADGTRRSRPELFEGRTDTDGGRVYGLAAFIPQAASIASRDLPVLAAAFPVVSRMGQAAHGSYDNLYFFTPENRLVMFGPDRADRLMFYRHDAPASLDFSKEEMSRFSTPQANPTGETRCTSLQRLLQDTARVQRVATACITPAYVKGRFVGAFGSSINLAPFFGQVVVEGFPGAETLIVRNDGELIAAPRAPLAATRNEAAVLDYQRSLGLAKLTRQLASAKQPFGVVRSAGDIIAYGRLQGPGWYLLERYPAAQIAWSAAESASWTLLLGLVGAAIQTVVLMHLAQGAVVRPLQALADSCVSDSRDRCDVLAARTDEIGVLARSLYAERTRSEELMASLEDRVRQRTAELERANAEKSRFLANMSHELRTPLNGVIALSETLAKQQTSPRNVEVAELIVSSGRLLEQVLTDILDFSKIEAGEMRLETQPFDLKTTVSRVAELHRASAESKGLSLSWTLDPSVDGAYLGDSVRLTQVLSNLLSNGVKFTPAGAVTLSVGQGEAGLRFVVADTGIGFDESVRASLFQRFEQADLSIRRRFGGTGLGLAICQSLVTLMGGWIEARSAPGAGSIFSFEVPLAQAVIEVQAAQDQPWQDSAPLQGVRILLAEDHPTNQKIVQLILDGTGVELTIVENGLLALDALDREPFDLVLMDMQMPELDGLAATAVLRKREVMQGVRRTPVIMLTANALDEHRRASHDAGADHHLTKPVRALELLSVIGEVVSAADAQAEIAIGGVA